MNTRLRVIILLSVFVISSTIICKGQDENNKVSIEQKIAKTALPIKENIISNF